MATRELPSADAWPFVDRNTEIWEAEDFLRNEYPDAPSRQLYIAGASGIGKSFFVRELICRFAEHQRSGICLYADVSESALELAALEKRLAAIALTAKVPQRSDPQQIPSEVADAAERRLVSAWKRRAYQVGRIVGSITKLDKILNELPKELDAYSGPDFLQDGEFWNFLVQEAAHRPVLLALDNVQRQADWSKLDLMVGRAPRGVRLVVVESLQGQQPSPLRFRAFGNTRKEIVLDELPDNEACNLVIRVVGDGKKERDLAARWVGRFHGHPKELEGKIQQYFKRGAESNNRITNFQDRITALPGRDQLVLRLITMLRTPLSRENLQWLLDRLLNPFPDAGGILDDLVDDRFIEINQHTQLVTTEHDIVNLSLRSAPWQDDDFDIREPLVRFLNARLDAVIGDDYARIADNLFDLALPEDFRRNPDLQLRLNDFIYKLHGENNYRYLTNLYDKPSCHERLQELPRRALRAFLDAFQKTSKFDQGLVAIRAMREAHVELEQRDLDLAKAKYLVQLFEYGDAKSLLTQIEPRSDSDLVLFNIINIEADDEAARAMITRLPGNDSELDEYQCVMLRNCGHLYPIGEARQFVKRALTWFNTHGSTFAFGKATTENNLGVLELWARNYGAARFLLQSAQKGLASLGSNEVYQPYVNLACLHALEGDIKSAQVLLAAAKEQVPTSLHMDVLMIALNELMLGLMAGSIGLASGAQTAVQLYGEASVRTQDTRFREHIAWFANQLLSRTSPGNRVPVSADFDKRFLLNDLCSTNIFAEAVIAGEPIPIVFQLSTHWRY
jgi:hypothetical protein